MAQVDLQDERLTSINNEKQNAINEINQTYNNMINQSDSYYNQMIQNQEDFSKQQSQLQQQQSDLAIEQINKAQEDTTKDYEKEQKAAYVDLMKQQRSGNQQMLNSGLYGTGYSETVQASMYNQYQNRVATARESYNKIISDYEIAKKDAILKNSSALMEIAFNTQQQKLQLMLQGFQYKNELLQTQINMKNETEDRYTQKWNTMLNQINTEREFDEQVRQYNENKAFQQQQFEYQKQQDALAQQNWEKQYALALAENSSKYGSGGSGGTGYPYTGKSPEQTTSSAVNGFNTTKNASNTPDYYFESNGYQPRYINDKKIYQAEYNGKKLTAADLGLGVTGTKKIWTNGDGNYYVWSSKTEGYVPVNDDLSDYVKSITKTKPSRKF